ncbi:hypothetical protein [Agromyces albus]|uniref:hypothetical protein n=1 Tax=Agromyces albus TaxID=205332 RepID=UPI00278B2C62|nr:hypothetical protein [Agromyces albus]MDQ0576725.1 hypothetical protein [Agromyces albus]
MVRDAFALNITPEDEYVESEVALELLEFASSAVGGLAAAATDPAAGAVRSSSTVAVPLADSAGSAASASLTVTLYGPGDVRGLESTQIVRRFPTPGARTAEETVLAHVEFDRPELPWAFSAEPPGAQMRPWLTLVVVERASVMWEPATTALLPVMQVPLAQLPSLARAHLWAHAQAPRSSLPPEKALTARLSPAHAPVNLSRLLSTRVLKQDTDYLAAVVPTTDVGVRGGLGLPGGSLDAAWTSGSPDPVRLPVYDSWEFRTGPDGDFRALALRLQGVVAPYEVGRRFIDTSAPGSPLRDLADGEVGPKQVLRCAVFSPTPPPPEKAVAEHAAWPPALVDDLRAELDLPAGIEGAAASAGGIPDLPIVGPRIYARLHRGSAVIEGTDWFAELNLAPAKRIVAGLGTRVVQKDQEQLMQAAWAQLGEVERANRAIRLAQLAELLATRLHDRLRGLDAGRLLQVTAPLARRVAVDEHRTLFGAIAASATPATVTLGAYRRVTRPGGPMVRRADASAQVRLTSLVGADGAMRDFTRVYRNPDGVGGLSAEVVKELDVARVAEAIDLPSREVLGVLASANELVVEGGTFAGYLTKPERWKAPDATFEPGRDLADRWGQRLLEPAVHPVLESIRAQRVGPLLAELAGSKLVRGSAVGERLEGAAVQLNDRVIEIFRPEVRPPERPGPGRVLGGATGTFGRLSARGAAGRVGGVGERGIDVTAAAARGIRLTDLQLRAGTTLRAADVARLEPLGPVADRQAKDAGLARFAELAEVKLTPVLDRIDDLPLEVLRAEMSTLVDPGALLTIAPVPHRDLLTVDAAEITRLLEPALTVRQSLNGRLRLSAEIGAKWFAKPRIEPIMAAPRFDRPMYRALEAFDRDWLVPGLGLLPANDFVTVLSTNSEFMEAFLVGLSDEMGRELLWRGYPTDQRGTYFHRFWSPQRDELTGPVHAFAKTGLGKHISLGGTGGSGGRAVIVVKSELVRRFPDLVIQAVKNQGTVAEPVFETVAQPQITATVLFAEHLDPDIALVGVDLSVEELDGNNWWIVIAEHPGATRFQRPGDDQLPATAKFLTDNAADAAAYADLHLHRPVRVAFEATDLIVTGA